MLGYNFISLFLKERTCSLMDFYSLILTLAILGGQLIKVPIGGGGVTLLDIVVIIFCILGLFKAKFQLKRPPFFIKVSFIFIFIALLSLIFTPLQLTSFEFFVSFSYLARFCLYILMGWLIYCEVFPILNKKIIPLFVLSGTTLAIAGLLQLIFIPDLRFLEKFGWDPHYFRSASTFFDPNFLGAYMVLTLILWYQKFAIVKKWYLFFINFRGFSIRGFLYKFTRAAENLNLIYKHTPRKTVIASEFIPAERLQGFLLAIIGVIIFITLLTTFSRGAYLAFLISFLTLAILKKSIRLGLISIFLFFILILGFQIYQQDVAQPRNIDRAQSAETRLTTWQQGLQIFTMNPILGVGFNSYRYALAQNNFANTQFLQSHGASTNDSTLLYVASTTGILGFISYLFFLLSLALTKNRNLILIAALVGLIAQSFFANTLFYPPILLWIILMAI